MRNHRITIGLRESSYQALRDLCGETGESMSETVAGLVEASEGVFYKLTSFHRMAREAQESWKEKTVSSLVEIQSELEPMLERALRLMGDESAEERSTEGPHVRATRPKGRGEPPSSNTGVRLVRTRGKVDRKGGVP